MARWVKAQRKNGGASLLTRLWWVLITAFILFALLSPQFGVAQDEGIKRAVRTSPLPQTYPTAQLPGFLSMDKGRTPFLSGNIQQGTPPYRFKLAERHHITPEFSVNYDDTDGEPSPKRADFRLTYSYLGDPVVLVVNALIEYAGYDRKSPAFAKSGNDDRFGLSTSVYYTTPWVWSPLRGDAIKLFATGEYRYTDSNVDFYKQESASGFAGVLLEW